MGASTPRERIRRHAATLLAAVATVTPPIVACACDYLPAPARATVDGTQLDVNAIYVRHPDANGQEDAGHPFIDITVEALGGGHVEFEGELKSANVTVIEAHGGATLKLRVVIAPDTQEITGQIAVKTDHQGATSTSTLTLHVDTRDDRNIGGMPRAFLTTP